MQSLSPSFNPFNLSPLFRTWSPVAACLIFHLIPGVVSAAPTTEQIFAMRALPEPLVSSTGNSSADENSALIDALNDLSKRSRADDFSALEKFIAANPTSPWRLAVLTNLGLLQYHAGYFSKCISTYRQAWEAGKSVTAPKAKALADRAAGEYAKMLARVGRYDEIDAFFTEIGSRTFEGPATELIAAARQGRALMAERPEVAFRCGPLALSSILREKGKAELAATLHESKSTRDGISLGDVAALSRTLGMNYQPAKRSPGAALVFPSVIHWKVGHYAALIGEEGGKYHTKDPTFQNDTWHSPESINDESSGYFLVPPGPLPAGWTIVGPEEAKQIFGKGNTDGTDPKKTSPDDQKSGGDSCNTDPMAAYSFHTMVVSLNIVDTPLRYSPPYGHPINFTVTYNQREAGQPSNFTYSNLGPKWTFNWLSYITDDPGIPSSASLAVAGGGTHEFSGYSPASGQFASQKESQTLLTRVSTTPLRYELEYSDGAKDVFTTSDGSALAPRKVFLTERRDPHGNLTQLAYDGLFRLTTITDALGQLTAFSYEHTNPYFITRVTDPFGRQTILSYNGAGRLVKIRDIIGIESDFAYSGTSDFIQSLTTPYGTTSFSTFESGRTRRLTATDPQGDTEVLEFNENPAAQPNVSPPDAVPVGMFAFNAYLYARNSYFWSKKAWKEAPNSYSAAHVYHWLHSADYTQATSPLESEKPAHEVRTWYNYPGQPQSNDGALVVGNLDKPSKIGRRLDDGSTELKQYSYNSFGNVTSAIDPLGRTTLFAYAPNGQDLLTVTQQGGGVLSGYTYNSQHLPLTHTDAAGQATTFTYNAQGQPTTVTNALTEKITFNYFAANVAGKQRKGRLSSIDGPLAGSADSTGFDYDIRGNLAQVTGPDGYFVKFTYDTLDRVLRTTYPDETYDEASYQLLDSKTRRDRLGRITTYDYNSIRQLIAVTDPADRKIGYEWCKCGDLKRIIDAMGRATTWRHDVQGRVTAKEYADGSMIRYAYEPKSGRLASVIDAKGQVKRTTYNTDGTIAGKSYLNAEHPTLNVSFVYDPVFSRLISMTDGIGTTAYTYYPNQTGILGAGKLANSDGPFTDDTLAYTYDALGRKTGYSINGVGEIATYDALGRVTQTVNPLGTFTYTFVGSTSRPDTATYPGGMTRTYSYHPLLADFRLKDIIHTLPGGTPLSRQSYEYNAVGNINRWTQVIPSGGTSRSWLIGYDAADQITSVNSQDPQTLTNLLTGQYAFTYDPAGNRTSETIDSVSLMASYTLLNQIVNQIGSAADGDITFEWDANNRMIAINYSDSNHRSEFLYDGLGRRRAVIEKDNGVTTESRRFVWNDLQMIEERDMDSVSVKRRYFENGMQFYEAGNLQPKLFGRDHLGSVNNVISDTGAVVADIAFDPWGKRTVISGEDETSLAFTGYWLHSRSKLSAAPYRIYAPSQGRWLSRDPIAELDNINLYAYVHNNFVNKIDPLGLAELTLITTGQCPCGTKEYRVELVTGPGIYGRSAFVCAKDTPTPQDTVKDRGTDYHTRAPVLQE